MPRCCKRRRICGLPRCRGFQPENRGHGDMEPVEMTVDEYETIRLIDQAGLTQEECAAQMNVARTTVQAIYAGARKKLADCLVDGRGLQIRGGEYEVCGSKDCCGCRKGCRYRQQKEGEDR